MGHKHEPQTPVPKVPKLHRRNGNSSSYYLRKRIPSDLVKLGVYGSQRDFKKSLGTSDHKIAKRIALTLLMEWEEEWEEKRKDCRKARPKKTQASPFQYQAAILPFRSGEEGFHPANFHPA